MNRKIDRGMAKFCMKCPQLIILYRTYPNQDDKDRLNGRVLVGCNLDRNEYGIHYKRVNDMVILRKDHDHVDYQGYMYAPFFGAVQLPQSLRNQMRHNANMHGCFKGIEDKECCFHAERMIDEWNN